MGNDYKVNLHGILLAGVLLIVVVTTWCDAVGAPAVNLRTKSQLTEVVQFYNASEVFSDASIPRHKLIFVVLLTDREIQNENDCIMPKVLPAIELAIRHIQKIGFAGVNFDVELVSRNTFCSSTYGAIGFYEIYSKLHEIHAIFGLSCDYVLAPISRYAGVWEIPVLSTSGRSYAFDAKEEQYRTLTRLMGSVSAVGHATQGLMDTFNWTHTAFILQNDPDITGNSICYLCGLAVRDVLSKSAVDSSMFLIYETQTVREMVTGQLKKIASMARVVIMCADPESIRQIMIAAEDLNMIESGEYVFINIQLFSKIPLVISEPWYDANDTDANNLKARNAYTALLTVTPEQPEDDEYVKISNEIKTLTSEKYNYTFDEFESLSTFVTSFYDGVLLYAAALNESITEDPTMLNRPINGSDMVRRMWNRTFTGITGQVNIDANGDRVSTYSLLDLNPVTGRFEIVARLVENRLVYENEKSIHWAGGRLQAPPDTPECGYDGSLCQALPGYAILSIVLGFLVIIMAIGSFIGYRHYKSEAEINSMSWKINPDEVVIPETVWKTFRGSIHSLVKRNSQVTLMSEDMGSLGCDRQIFIPVGMYKGCRVAIKPVKENSINLNRSLMLELKRMKDIQHDHLVKFFGACLDPPKCFLLTEYCPKGSLQDILENDQIQLDWMFKLSLMHDIVRGMHFLHHSDLKSHGNLKSSNCVVDSRFVLKITDFGLHSLRKSDMEGDEENCNSYAYWKKFLWTAPELLKMHERPLDGTQKADVYAFGIIVHEITTRQGPFYLGASADKSPQEIIHLVKAYPSNGLSQPFRPHISHDTSESIKNIMTRCWSEDPNERLDFHCLKTIIRKINKENETGNIVDNLLQRMEQYANNLEGLVQERTQDYLEEKKKCEQLLYQLLPQSVAAQLIRGQPVIAETFDHVTIYFSDIVGFTAISAESTPMQVVKFLNDLYTCFDSIVEHFDVYKVETIGDAYMVVSGLPERNGNLHAREIARLALALLEAVHTFEIHHRPHDRLRLRIGLHSGPCVAGVVGQKMPRYCLFGDTVNTASRMESNGEALKIHISESTKRCLDEFGSFITTERGLVPMKGKGEQLTYWLDGERPTPAILPRKLQPAASPPPYSLNSSPTQSSHMRRKFSSSTPKLNNDDHKTDDQSHKLLLQPFSGINHNKNSQDSLPTAHFAVAIADPRITEQSNFIHLTKSNLNRLCRNNDIDENNTCSPNRSNTSLTFNNIVKVNNLKNFKIICNNSNASEDNAKSVTQPLLGRIAS